jgi:hypothetical protein
LEVTRKTAAYVPALNGIAQVDRIIPVAREFVRAKDLAGASWRQIPLRFYASGEELWEYLVLAFDGISAKPDNLTPLGNNIRVLFDTVEIRRTKKMIVPWG